MTPLPSTLWFPLQRSCRLKDLVALAGSKKGYFSILCLLFFSILYNRIYRNLVHSTVRKWRTKKQEINSMNLPFSGNRYLPYLIHLSVIQSIDWLFVCEETQFWFYRLQSQRDASDHLLNSKGPQQWIPVAKEFGLHRCHLVDFEVFFIWVLVKRKIER